MCFLRGCLRDRLNSRARDLMKKDRENQRRSTSNVVVRFSLGEHISLRTSSTVVRVQVVGFCEVCTLHARTRFRFSSAFECRSTITMVFLAVLIEAGLVLYSSLIVFRGQVSSGSAGYLPFVRLTDRTFASPTARSYALSTGPPWEKVRFHARA